MTDFPAIKTVGFIGLGIMGQSMAGHILAGGYQLHVYNRSRAKADDLVAKGAVWHDQPGEMASVCDVVITIVGFPQDVENIYLAPDGLVAQARPGTMLIDMTTSSPSLAQRIAAVGTAEVWPCLNAPVPE